MIKPAIGAAAALVALLSLAAETAAATPALRVGGSAAALVDLNFARADRAGDVGTVFGDGTQAATVVLFVSARCPCSADYDARTVRLAREFPRVRFVRVYSDRGEPVEEMRRQARAFAQAPGRTDSVFDFDGRAMALLGPEVTPEAFVFDAGRVLRYRGRIDDDQNERHVKKRELRDALAALLAARPVLTPTTKAMGCPILKGGQNKRRAADMEHDR